MEEAERRHPVHTPTHERFDVPAIVFLTVCAKDRNPILANANAHNILRHAWTEAASWVVGRYVIMPDHLHLFCSPEEIVAPSLTKWVSFWKSLTARRWHRREEAPIWQRHFWDTQLRRGESYTAKWEYVVQNPVRAGLVSRAEDWPYQGEMSSLRW